MSEFVERACEALEVWKYSISRLRDAQTACIEAAETPRVRGPEGEPRGIAIGMTETFTLAGADAAATNISLVLDRMREHALDRVGQIARLVARDIIETARAATEPITWITGNSHMPPLRDIPACERVYQVSGEGELWPGAFPWEVLVETIERELDTADVLMSAPEFDNALYVVDLRRWERVDEDEAGDELADEWRAIEQPE